MSDLKSEIDDAFKGMPDLSTPAIGKKDTSSINQKSTRSVSTMSSEVLTKTIETGTNVYVGKKHTGTFEIKPGKKLKDTTLSAVSIDTDCNVKIGTENISDTKVTSISETSIDMTELGRVPSSAQSNYPCIIEEEEVSSALDPPQPQRYSKKEKLQHPNLSLDISPSISNTNLPSDNEQLPLGSGVVAGVLGSGGMAKVYKIWNEKLEVFRAVKILLPSHSKDSFKRFQTEAKISAKLRHPNIVEIHSIGEWNDLPFIEMEFVDGNTLNEIITHYKVLPSIFTSAIAVQVARALEYAHSKEVLVYGKTYKGLIHRDLKPSNIIIGNCGQVKLMDFGVARPIETGLHTINTESLVGTMHYFSPEQIDGHPIDQLSDIYSFGAVLYEMLCGVNPFSQTSMIELVRAKIKNQFTRLEDFHIPFDPRLASIAQICLRTEKADRFDSSQKLRLHLEEIHNSFAMGSPEHVTASFFSNPQAMYEQTEKYISQSTKSHVLAHQSETESIDLDDTRLNVPTLPVVHTVTNVTSNTQNVRKNKNQKLKVISIVAATVAVAAILFVTLSKYLM